MEEFREQARRFGTEFLTNWIREVDLSQRPFKIVTDGQVLWAQTLIIASGASAKWLGIPGEAPAHAALGGLGVSACATCDGFFFKGKKIVVVGGGDTAMEEANFLTRYASSVTIIHRRNELRASKIMQEKAFKNEKIDFIWDTAVEEILGTQETGVTGVRLRNLTNDEESVFACEGVFIAIGHKPNTELFKGQLEMDEVGYLRTAGRTMATNVPGVFACGDVQDSFYRQAITAAGTGCMARCGSHSRDWPLRRGLQSGHGREGRPSARRRIAGSVDLWIRNTLKVLVHHNTFVTGFDAGLFQTQVLNLRHAAGAVYHHIGLYCLLLVARGHSYRQMAGCLLNTHDGCI